LQTCSEQPHQSSNRLHNEQDEEQAPDRVLYGDGGVYPVLIVEVDVVNGGVYSVRVRATLKEKGR
jgi:hypothetical protein